MPKYKESKNRSSLVKNAKLLSTCPPRTHLFRTNSWSEGCSSDNTSENTLVIHPQWLTAHKIFLLWGKGERGLIPSAVSHRWIKKCAFTLVQAVITWSMYKIKITCMKPGYLHFSYLTQHYRRSQTLKSTERHKSWTGGMLPYGWEWTRGFPQYSYNDKQFYSDTNALKRRPSVM